MYLFSVIVEIYLLGHRVPVWLGVLATVAIGLLIGIINAVVITRFHVIPNSILAIRLVHSGSSDSFPGQS
jgi:ribose/xylose/arabinose/galactoside ABC-type transport system permease subunit